MTREPPDDTPLGRLVREMIVTDGPMSLRDYMALCLGHPAHGYYMSRDPFGAAGDFTTAPEISQMFGELVGLWAAECWDRMGRPPRLALVELGPGRGTLMADALRAGRALPGFLAALSVHLIETSPVLRHAQAATLQAAGVPVSWHAKVADVPPGPVLVVANEFFDALPIRQFIRGEDGWRERLVGLDAEGQLVFGLSIHPERRIAPGGRPGDVMEVSEAASEIVGTIATRLVRDRGAALAIDYGHGRTAPGDTLQAVSRHAFTDPLASPGEADLTAHVDFAALARNAARAGALVHGPVAQGPFLRALGIEARAARLRSGSDPARAAGIDAALARLTGSGEGEMGALFKVMAFSDPSLPDLPGLFPSVAPVSACREDALQC